MARGYVYLRLQKGHGFCFGKTNDHKRRDREYRKENPFLRNVAVFSAADMDRAEREMMRRTAHLRLFSNSKEWLRETTEVVTIFAAIRVEFEASATTVSATAVSKGRDLYATLRGKELMSDWERRQKESRNPSTHNPECATTRPVTQEKTEHPLYWVACFLWLFSVFPIIPFAIAILLNLQDYSVPLWGGSLALSLAACWYTTPDRR